MYFKACGRSLLWSWKMILTETIFKIASKLKSIVTILARLSQKMKKLEYQKSLLTMDFGWSNKLSCKISAFYLENRKSGGHLKFQQATNKIEKSWISKIKFYFKNFLPLKTAYGVNCWCTKSRNTRNLILAIFKLFIVLESLQKLQMVTWFSVFKVECWNFAWKLIWPT